MDNNVVVVLVGGVGGRIEGIRCEAARYHLARCCLQHSPAKYASCFVECERVSLLFCLAGGSDEDTCRIIVYESYINTFIVLHPSARC